MKNVAFVLLAAGFLFGAYATALDTDKVNWTIFVVAAIAAIAGVILAKRLDKATATSGDVLETNRNELNESIGNIVRDLNELTNGDMPHGAELREWIDEKLRPDLRRFVDARESMVHLYSLQTYADIMSEFASAERYINRVWSSSADDYDLEADTYMRKAAEQFKQAQRELASASRPSG